MKSRRRPAAAAKAEPRTAEPQWSRLMELRARHAVPDRGGWGSLGEFLGHKADEPARALAWLPGPHLEFLPPSAREAWYLAPVDVPQPRTGVDAHYAGARPEDLYLAPGSLDACFAVDTLPTFASPEKLLDFLQQALQWVSPEGYFVAAGPNFRYCQGHYFDTWENHLPLTEISVAEALTAAGFTVKECRDRFLPYNPSGLRPAARQAMDAYLRLSWAWSLFGERYLVIAQRKTRGPLGLVPGPRARRGKKR